MKRDVLLYINDIFDSINSIEKYTDELDKEILRKMKLYLMQ